MENISVFFRGIADDLNTFGQQVEATMSSVGQEIVEVFERVQENIVEIHERVQQGLSETIIEPTIELRDELNYQANMMYLRIRIYSQMTYQRLMLRSQFYIATAGHIIMQT